MNHRRETPPRAPDETTGASRTLTAALRTAWASVGGTVGVLVTAAPTVVFVLAGALGGLTVGIVAAGVTAVGALVHRLARHEAPGGALVGFALVATCALVAALTGEARGFFLLPTALPALILLVCLGTVLARRPLTGLLLNRLAGGPAGWRRHRGLVRVYDVTTLIAVAVNAVNFTLQAVSYAADQTAVLALAHAATGPIFATLVAGTLVAARRRIALDPTT